VGASLASGECVTINDKLRLWNEIVSQIDKEKKLTKQQKDLK
jgi:hypothetical protein